MALFRKDKTHITAKLHRTDLIICTHSREGKTPSYSQINMVVDLGGYDVPIFLDIMVWCERTLDACMPSYKMHKLKLTQILGTISQAICVQFLLLASIF